MIARVRHYEKDSTAADRPPLRSPQVYTAMMASLAPLANLAPYHIMLYGTLLGTELYQVFPPPTVDSMRRQTEPTPELRHDQSLLQRIAHARLHHTAETRLPRILPPTIPPLPLDGSYSSTIRPCVPCLLGWRSGTNDAGRSIGGVEFGGVWTQDTGSDGGEDSSR